MKTTVTAAVLAVLFASQIAGGAPSADDNRGVLNGPLTKGGHRASGEGNRESLKLAIEDLIATYGAKYPKGKEFLQRLEGIKDEKSEEFLALKKEALLANPVLDFAGLLMVRSSKGKRFTANWQTRCSADAMGRKMSQKDVDNVLNNLSKKDKSLAALNKAYSKWRGTYDKQKKKIERSDTYRKERNRKKRAAMLNDDPVLKEAKVKRDEAEKALKEAAKNLPEYQEAVAKMKSGAVMPNYDDELILMSPICDGKITTVYKPNPGKFVGDVDLHWDGDRILFASHVDPDKLTPVPDTRAGKGYAVFEMELDPKTAKMRGAPRQVTPDMGWDVDCYDACYLPDGHVIFASTAAYEGVPCVGGGSYVANLYIMDGNGKSVRRLTFDQDASWHPSVRENGRVMYTRWEYTDSAHYYSRVLMTMNPDGTDQKAFYGSNSYWPNSMFFAREIPGKTGMFVATITGHHSHAKGGALCLFDVSRGRHEADGAIQFITGRGKKVEPLVIDNLARSYSPMFFHPYPLSEKYFLAMTGGSVYLLDVFDNMLCLKARDGGGSYYEPIPFMKRKAPPVVAHRIDPECKVSYVLINDIYMGPGLAGIPRGTVKNLRVYRYEYGPRHKGGHYSMGMEGGWDAKQVIGTVPVEKDGSVSFEVPANTPIAFQPLDAEGKALQIMRSWTVTMPGERLTCVGCHESQNMPTPSKPAAAMVRKPSVPKPFYGPMRGYGFTREVYPVIEKYCVACHDGTKDLDANGCDKKGRYKVADRIVGTGSNTGKKFAECGIPDFSKASTAHTMLHPYVRRNGPEGDYHLLAPMEFHADTGELYQMLQKGHHNVKLDQESWDRLVTWSDLNAPFKGSWTEAGANRQILKRRMELRKLYANDDYNPEVFEPLPESETPAERVVPKPCEREVVAIRPPEVKSRTAEPLSFDLGDGIVMKLAPIPAGSFSLGSNDETPVEQPVTRVTIDKPFYMGTTEVTLEQYRLFDPDYLNGVYDMHYKDQVHRGYYMNDMQYPVIRVTWQKAMEFCSWLSAKTGKKVTLPTEAQWEWACRAGTDTQLSYGNLDTEFSTFANLADVTVKKMAVKGVNPRPISNPNSQYDFELKDPRSNDGALHLAEVGSYEPNPWGLYDMHGNAAEWMRSDYKPYPYEDNDGRNAGGEGRKTVRGGSWHDRPFRSTSSYRLGYPQWQRVYHTGFRVVVE